MSFPPSSLYQATLFLPKSSSTTPSPLLFKTLPRQWRRLPDPIGGGRRNGGGAAAAADRGVCAGGAAFAPLTAAGLGVVGCWWDPRFVASAGTVPARSGLPWEGGGGESQARVEYGGQIRGGVEVTVTCYQLLGLPRKAVKDEL